jgi:hypothetical protein
MKISHTEDLAQLAALMGPNATPDEPAAMRDALIGAGRSDTDLVSRSDWLDLLDLVVAGDAAARLVKSLLALLLIRTSIALMRE